MSFKKGKTWGAGLLLSIALLSSCKSLKNTNTLFLSEYDKFADTAKSVYVANENSLEGSRTYRIKPHDVIALRNLQNPEGIVVTSVVEGVQNAAIFRCDSAGVVHLPVVGFVVIKGLTASEAASKIQILYGKALLKNPIIDLTVVNNKVVLLGETPRPGNYQLDGENVNLIELVGKSGGFIPSSDTRKIKIIRGDLKNPEVIYVNLKNLKSLGSNKLILRKDDIIYIPARSLHNFSESIRNYTATIQPVFLILNAALLIYTLRR